MFNETGKIAPGKQQGEVNLIHLAVILFIIVFIVAGFRFFPATLHSIHDFVFIRHPGELCILIGIGILLGWIPPVGKLASLGPGPTGVFCIGMGIIFMLTGVPFPSRLR